MQRQYERDRIKTEALRDSDPGSSSSSAAYSSFGIAASHDAIEAQDHVDFHELERGEHAGTAAQSDIDADCKKAEQIGMAVEPVDQQDGEVISRTFSIKSFCTAMDVTLTGIDARDRKTKGIASGENDFVVGYEGEKDVINGRYVSSPSAFHPSVFAVNGANKAST